MTDTVHPDKPCAHCGQPMRGFGYLGRAGEPDRFLCHPDTGPDCYHLVTVYDHPTPCPGGDGGLRFVDGDGSVADLVGRFVDRMHEALADSARRRRA